MCEGCLCVFFCLFLFGLVDGEQNCKVLPGLMVETGKRNNPFGIPFGISLIAELKIGVN